MKKRWIAIVAVAAIAVAVVLKIRPWPAGEPSEIYKRCAATEGVEATWIKDLAMDDGSRRDVTLVEAATEAGWEAMCRLFRLPPNGIDSMPSDILVSYLSLRDHPDEALNGDAEAECDLVVANYERRQVYVFRIDNARQMPGMGSWTRIVDKK